MNGNTDEQRLLHQRRKLRDKIVQPSAPEMESGDIMFKIFDKQWQDVIYHFACFPPSRTPASPTTTAESGEETWPELSQHRLASQIWQMIDFPFRISNPIRTTTYVWVPSIG